MFAKRRKDKEKFNELYEILLKIAIKERKNYKRFVMFSYIINNEIVFEYIFNYYKNDFISNKNKLNFRTTLVKTHNFNYESLIHIIEKLLFKLIG